MIPSLSGMAERLRTRLRDEDILAVAGTYDVLSAILAEQANFEAVFLSGYGVAASFLGNPDIGLTSVIETAQVARNMVTTINVPLIVDVDNGYGNEENVKRTVYEAECAGVAAIQLEDQVSPKRCGHTEGKQVLPQENYLRKLEAALRARQTDLVVIARTDAKDLDEAIKRANSYRLAGADATLIDGLSSLDAVQRVGEEVTGIKVINLIEGGKTPSMNVESLQAMGFGIVLYSTPALYIATKALQRWLPQLQKGKDLRTISDACVSFSEFQNMLESNYRSRFN